MSDYEMFEVVRVRDGDVMTELNDRQTAKNLAQQIATAEGEPFRVVRKTVQTTRTPVRTFHPVK